MGIRWFLKNVCTDVTMYILYYFFTDLLDFSWVNLIDDSTPLRYFIKVARELSSPFQMKKMSSMNLTQSIMYHSVRYTNVSSNRPIYTLAKLGAALVPIAVPLT